MDVLTNLSTLDGAAVDYTTHEVLNQPGPLHDYDAYAADVPLTEAVRAFGADWADAPLRRAGALVGSERVQYGLDPTLTPVAKSERCESSLSYVRDS